jgi:hypothetical protein
MGVWALVKAKPYRICSAKMIVAIGESKQLAVLASS